MAWWAVGVSVAGIAVSAGMAASSRPSEPNLVAGSQGIADTNAALLPVQRALEAAQQTGGTATFTLPAGTTPEELANASGVVTPVGGYQQQVYIPGSYFQQQDGTNQNWFQRNNPNAQANQPGQWVPYSAADFAAGGKYASIQNPQIKSTQTSNQATANFTGIGQADVQAAIAKQTAANQLATAQQFDPKFIAQALSQQAQADPQSFAARAEEAKLVQDQIDRPINSPVSDMLNQQVQDSLTAAKNHSLTDMDTQRLNAAVAQAQSDRGGPGPNADFSIPLTTGFAGEQRQANAAAAAQGFLGSGSSPEDIAYRREQQNLGNLSAEVNGKTPQSQFASMSGAQSGPTPMMTAAPLSVLPGDQSQAAAQVAIQNWNTANRASASQVNPWMQGLSGAMGLAGAAGSAGWKPFAPSS